MKSKKIVSLVLAMIMALSLAVPAFAAATNSDSSLSQTTTVTGSTTVPTFKITVPSTGTVTLNPYKMEVSLNGVNVTDQIVSATQWIENKSDVPVTVKAAVNATVAGNTKLATASVATGKVTTNSVYMYLQGKVTDDASTAVTTWGSTIAVAAAKGKEVEMGTLAQGSGGNTAATGGCLAFRLNGDAVANPATAWTAADKVDAAIVFTFVPGTYAAPAPTPSVTIATTGTVTGGSAGAFTLTATPANLTGKNPTYSWAVTTDANSIVDSFADSTAATQTVNIKAAATTGQTATLTLTVKYDDAGTQDGTLTETVTVTVG